MLGAISHEFPEFSHVATRGAVLPLLLSPPTASHSLCSAGSAPHNDAAATGDFLETWLIVVVGHITYRIGSDSAGLVHNQLGMHYSITPSPLFPL